MTQIESLRVLIGLEEGAQPELLTLLLSMATDTILDVIGRDTLPERLQSAVVQLAAVSYNKRGNEGSSSMSEGGLSVSWLDELPPDVRKRIANYKRKAGVVYADDSQQTG